MPTDFTYMWNLKKKIKKQNRNRLIENTLWIASQEEGWVDGL